MRWCRSHDPSLPRRPVANSRIASKSYSSVDYRHQTSELSVFHVIIEPTYNGGEAQGLN